MPGFHILQISQLPFPHGKLPRSASSLNFNFERTKLHVLSLGYGKLYVEVWVTPLLAQVTFVHADAPSLIHQKQYLTLGEK